MQPPPAHPDTAADILCQKWKIAPARDGKIRKDCHDMHVVFWVEIRGTKSLEEFLLSAFRKPSSDQRLNSLQCLNKRRRLVFFYVYNEVHIFQHHQKKRSLWKRHKPLCHIHSIKMKTVCLEKPKCGRRNKTVTEMERVVVVHFKHVLPRGPAALHKRSSDQRCRSIKKVSVRTASGFESGPPNAWLHYFNFRRPDLYE